MDIYWKLFGDRLREARLKIVPKLTQAKLGEATGVEGPSVSRWEHNIDRPEEFRFPDICRALAVSIEYFERRPEASPLNHPGVAAKIPDAIEFLSKFGALKPGLRDLVIALVFDEEKWADGANDADWPQWLFEQISKRST